MSYETQRSRPETRRRPEADQCYRSEIHVLGPCTHWKCALVKRVAPVCSICIWKSCRVSMRLDSEQGPWQRHNSWFECNALWTIKQNLASIRCVTVNRWNDLRTGVMWLYFGVFVNRYGLSKRLLYSLKTSKRRFRDTCKARVTVVQATGHYRTLARGIIIIL